MSKMKFSAALEHLRDGEYLARDSWPTADFVFIEGCGITKSTRHGDEDWTPSFDDLFAEDWYVVV